LSPAGLDDEHPMARIAAQPIGEHAAGRAGADDDEIVAQDKILTVFAAASMKNALDDVDAAYTAKTGVKVVASYAASSALDEADRTGRAGGRVRVRRHRLDGLCDSQKKPSMSRPGSICSATASC
jgi:hypothetical protein